MRFFSNIGQMIFATVLFLAASAEIASHMLDHGPFWWQNIQNVMTWFAKPDPAKITAHDSSGRGACIRYDKRRVDLRCDEKEDPGDRYLCKITIPPAERVCVEYAPPS